MKNNVRFMMFILPVLCLGNWFPEPVHEKLAVLWLCHRLASEIIEQNIYRNMYTLSLYIECNGQLSLCLLSKLCCEGLCPQVSTLP